MKAPLNRRVVVCGYEMATCLGAGLDATWERAVNNESGIGWLDRFDPGDYSVRTAGQIPGYDLTQSGLFSERELGYWNARFIATTVDLSKKALEKAGVAVTSENAHRIGSITGSAIGGKDAYENALNVIGERGPSRVSPFLLPNICVNLPGGMSSIKLGFTGPVYAIESACATGAHAVAESAHIIQRGDADLMIAGGVEFPLLPAIVYGFGNMRTLFRPRDSSDRAYEDASKASRPYSADRRGFVLAEGACMIVLAEAEYAAAHDLPVIAEVCGTAMNSDAGHYTQPRAQTITRCIRGALEDAGTGPDEIDYVNGHGTSTTIGDQVELECLGEIFGKGISKIPVSSNKSQLGHSLAAAAALETALSCECMKRGMLLPTINIDPEPEWDHLDYVPEARKANVSTVLVNSFGFGGANCCIVLKKG